MTQPDTRTEPGDEALRTARTAMYALISERVISNAPGDWMRFEDAVNEAFDRVILSVMPSHDPTRR